MPSIETVPLGGLDKPVQNAQQCGFAAAGRAHDADKLPLFDAYTDLAQRFDGGTGAAKGFAKVVRLQLHLSYATADPLGRATEPTAVRST